MGHPSMAWTIGRLAQEAGVSVETIRFYQRRGLLREPPRPLGGIRRYRPEDGARVRFIKSAQRMGFSLDEIHRLLQLDQGMQCKAAAGLALHHLDEVRKRLRDLKRLEMMLSRLLEQCHQDGGKVACPLIASLYEDSPGEHQSASSCA